MFFFKKIFFFLQPPPPPKQHHQKTDLKIIRFLRYAIHRSKSQKDKIVVQMQNIQLCFMRFCVAQTSPRLCSRSSPGGWIKN